METEGDIVCFDADTIAEIQRHCESYAIQRDAMATGVQLKEASTLRFAEFCNNQALMLDMIMQKPGENIVRAMYQKAIRGVIPIGSDRENAAFRELLGCLLGLYAINRVNRARQC